MLSLLVMMFVVAIPGYLVFASDVSDNIIEQVDPKSVYSIMANVLLTSHLLFAVVIIQNPIAQQIEEFFNVRQSVLVKSNLKFNLD